MIECKFIKNCVEYKRDQKKCEVCVNNTKRHYEEDHFVKAKDNPIPAITPVVTYDGPAEQSEGYKCPVCGEYTNPYMMRNSLCMHCGYKMRTR